MESDACSTVPISCSTFNVGLATCKFKNGCGDKMYQTMGHLKSWYHLTQFVMITKITRISNVSWNDIQIVKIYHN